MKAEAKSFKHFGVVKFEAHVCTYAAVPGGRGNSKKM